MEALLKWKRKTTTNYVFSRGGLCDVVGPFRMRNQRFGCNTFTKSLSRTVLSETEKRKHVAFYPTAEATPPVIIPLIGI